MWRLLSALILTSMCWKHAASKKLLQVNLVYRHGDRSPIEIYPNDVHKETDWPDGLGMLTQLGREQQTSLGLFLRQRYNDLLSDVFNPKEIYVRSSDMDRTLMSAYSNLAGLYAADHSVDWNGSFVSWQPVPVHSVPSEQDELLKMGKPCNALTAKQKEIIEESPEMKRLYKDYTQLLKDLLKLTGFEDPSNIWGNLRDTLFCERAHNMTWPDWAYWANVTCGDDPVIPCQGRTVFQLLDDFMQFRARLQADATALHKFMGGPLVIQMLDNMHLKVNKGSVAEAAKLYMYSAHDTTVAALLGALKIYNGFYPQYTATVMLELFEIDDKTQHIEVYYRNVTDSNKFYQLELKECGTPCTLDMFNKVYDKLRITDWDKECHNEEVIPGLSKSELVTISVCASIVVLLGLTAVICHARRDRSQRSLGYARVNT